MALYFASDVVGEVDCKEWENNDTGNGKHNSNYLTGYRDGGYVASNRDEVHGRPPQGCPVGIDLWIDSCLTLVKYKGAKIAEHEHDGEI